MYCHVFLVRILLKIFPRKDCMSEIFLPTRKKSWLLSLWYFLKYLEHRNDMVSVGIVRMSALTWYATCYCVPNGSDSTGQNVKHYLMKVVGVHPFLSAKHFYASHFPHARTRARTHERQLYSNFKTVRSEQLHATITQNLLLAQLFLQNMNGSKLHFTQVLI